MLAGVASNAATVATAASRLEPPAPACRGRSGLAGAGARCGASVGRYMPRVRLAGREVGLGHALHVGAASILLHLVAARGRTAASRPGRWPRTAPGRRLSGSVKFCSQPIEPLRARALEPLGVGDGLLGDRFAQRPKARCAHGRRPGPAPAPAPMISTAPGSASDQAKAKVFAASCFSVSCLCNRPAGVSPSTSASSSTAAKSACEPAGTW